jgi:RNA polymerase sigma-70 factor (ECF subfamily)
VQRSAGVGVLGGPSEPTTETVDVRPTRSEARDEVFDAAYRRVHAQLSAIASRHADGLQQAQELVQQAAYKAYVRYRAGRSIENLDGYLVTCVLSACMDLHRWSRRQRRALERLAITGRDDVDTTADRVVLDAEHEAVAAAFSRLDEDCRLMLHLRVIEGVPVREVAERLIIAEGTVKSRCARCLEKLDQLLGQER